MKGKAYARAGVDIALGNRVKASLPRLLASTRRPEVLGKIGGFGGLFAFKQRKYRQPVLVASVDGVGTKLKLAFAMDRHDTIGQDLVNHCVNDIAVLGAQPLLRLVERRIVETDSSGHFRIVPDESERRAEKEEAAAHAKKLLEESGNDSRGAPGSEVPDTSDSQNA